MELPLNVSKYFKKFGLDAWKVEPKLHRKFDNIIVIPALGEYENIKKTISSLNKSDSLYFQRSLVLVIVNNTVEVEDSIKNNNSKTLELLRKMSIKNIEHSTSLNLAFIDASSSGLELETKNGGVGLARKIGMDLALTLFDYNSNSKKLVICCDADCEVSSNYLTAIVEYFNNENASAGYIRFEHPINDESETTKAIICYELFLHYYVLSLKYAKSPYAIHTIGSTMICDHEAYINIQGMNKRKAAEDFYFMEKLAKSYTIHHINHATIYPSGRGSWRVPFGTGQRVNRYLAHELDEYQLYSPKSFQILKKWNEYYYDAGINDPAELIELAKTIDVKLYEFLNLQKFSSNFTSILQNSKTELQIAQQKRWWFDGFKTLKLIHWLRDEKYPNINMFDALDQLFHKLLIKRPVIRETLDIPELSIQKKYLNIIRELS